jgi:two-component system chemotaxis response regulator CheY
MTIKRILSVGQCSADHWVIERTLEQSVQADVVPADTATEALELLRQAPFDLVFVNRVLDSDGSAGIDLIKRIKGDEKLRQLPVMLISNYDDAQQDAIEAGALPGFGKAGLQTPLAIARVEQALGGTPAEQPSAEPLSE